MQTENLKKLANIVSSANNLKNKISKIPSMLSAQEQNLLYLMARDYWQGEGAIFDGGICLGGCTESLALGLAARKNLPAGKYFIWAYELALANEQYVIDFIKNMYGVERKFGESFEDIIIRNLSALPYSDKIFFLPGDALHAPYPEKIEIFFLDLCKLNEVNYRMQQLFSKMIPGKSVLIQQDYVHAWHPYIHTTMGYLAEYFEPIGIAWYSSFVFLLKKKIPREILNNNVYDTEPLDKLQEYLTCYYYLLDDISRNHLEMARAFLLYEKSRYNESYDILLNLKNAPPSLQPWDLKSTSNYLAGKMDFPALYE